MEDLNESTKVANLFQEVMILFKQSMSKVFEDSGITAPQGMVIGIISKEKRIMHRMVSMLISITVSLLA